MTYLVLDIETTGLDPDEDAILEIAYAFTDSKFELVVGTPKSFLIDQGSWQNTWNRLKRSQFVLDMHTNSGLLKELSDPMYKQVSLDRVWLTLMDDLREVRDLGEPIHLTGLSIHFDKAFLDANDFHSLWGGEDRHSLVHHRMLDLSSLKMMLGSAGIDHSDFEVENLNPHRAMSDVAATIGFARNARSFLQATGVNA